MTHEKRQLRWQMVAGKTDKYNGCWDPPWISTPTYPSCQLPSVISCCVILELEKWVWYSFCAFHKKLCGWKSRKLWIDPITTSFKCVRTVWIVEQPVVFTQYVMFIQVKKKQFPLCIQKAPCMTNLTL